MKRLLIILLGVMLLVACGNKEKPKVETVSHGNEQTAEQEDDRTDEEKAEDLKAANEKFKSDSVEYDYLSIFRDEVPVNTKVKFTGEVFVVGKEGFGGEFGMKQDLDGTTDGVLKVENMNIGDPVEIEEGKTLTVYGIYDGKDEMGAPVIKAVVIEEQ